MSGIKSAAEGPGTRGSVNSSVNSPKEQNDENGKQFHIAICGVGMRLPGGIRNTKQFWDLMTNGLDTWIPTPAAQDKDESTGGHAMHGGRLSEGLNSFDTSFFGMAEDGPTGCEPYTQKLREVTRECLEDACEVHYHGTHASVACYVAMPRKGDAGVEEIGTVSMAKRISQQYDLRGPR